VNLKMPDVQASSSVYPMRARALGVTKEEAELEEGADVFRSAHRRKREAPL